MSSAQTRGDAVHGRLLAALSFALLLPGCPITDDYYMRQSAPPPGTTDKLSTCGNALREGSEECDGADLGGARCDTRGFAMGVLGCSASCSFDVSGCSMTPPPGCGDRIADAGEDCDGTDFHGLTCETLGAGSGQLACTSGCAFDTSGCAAAPGCGDGKAERDEACDGADLKQQSCVSQGFDAGTLSCSASCELVTSGCTMAAQAVCGDGVANGTENCDGTDLGGGSCTAKGFTGGVLTCKPDCHFETRACTKEGVKCDFDGGSRTGVIVRADTSAQTSRVATWSCAAGGSGPDVSVSWTAPLTGCYQVMVTSDEDLDTILGVFSDCARTQALACDDNGGADQFSLLQFQATAGTTYAVVVDSYFDTDSGPVQVRVSPCAPREWTCDPAAYGRGDGCDCGCGALDPDCDGVSAATACAFCDAVGSCAPKGDCNAIRKDLNFACN